MGFANTVLDALADAGLRVELEADNTLNYRIRNAQNDKVPYMLIAGDREVENNELSIRLRSGENLDPMGVADAVAMIGESVANKNPH